MNPKYISAFFFHWCISVTTQLLSISNYTAVDEIIKGQFGPIVSYQRLGHLGGDVWAFLELAQQSIILTFLLYFFYQNHSVPSALFSVAALLCLFSLCFLLTKACFQSVTHCYFLFHWLLYFCYCCSFLFTTLQTYKISACANNTRHWYSKKKKKTSCLEQCQTFKLFLVPQYTSTRMLSGYSQSLWSEF